MDEFDDALRRQVADWPKDNVLDRPTFRIKFVGDPSWVFDLVATDDRVRGQALARHQSLIAASQEAMHRAIELWTRAGTSAPKKLRAVKARKAQDAIEHYRDQTLFGLLPGLEARDPEIRGRYAQFALLYLIWERRHPSDWRAQASNAWSPWTRKENLLRGLAKVGVPTTIRPQLTNLIVDLPQHPYRCKDWLYAPLTRQLPTDLFGQRMRPLLDASDPMVRVRAEFLLYVADNPTLKVTRQTFARWLANDKNDSLRESTSSR